MEPSQMPHSRGINNSSVSPYCTTLMLSKHKQQQFAINNMKFSSVLATFGLLAITQSSLIKRGGDDDDNEGHNPQQVPITPVVPHRSKPHYTEKFTLGVKIDGQVWLTFQEEDGQLEFDHIKYYQHGSKPHWGGHHQTFTIQPVTEDDSEPTGHADWKRGYDPAEEEEDDDNYTAAKYYPKSYSIKYQPWLPIFTLKNTVLKDTHERTGSIVANHQLQFDNPVQPDALYTNGFSIKYVNGYPLLALNDKTTFWDSQASSPIWKLYDKPITYKSRSVELVVIKVVY
ncbi:hypothetical protein FOB58_000835 [Candida parapsilosis]|uniref:Cell wall mannoprotein PIR1-like C-terminal domain-containing protein n=1 Tax=Candida parapsilosis TaxID=5480 RepID=A0A8X7TD16_CANPA|nr:hypothetical protein FOB58_000835 [Candida parapsilosis]KAF6056063.1 hypothetical protein FOB59_000575 [Candida parapsilosis]KAF6058994.1 hypothetical protein FOB60_000576 [Candida parapsilosis]KAF6067751.1 hypothetical protein FOB61_000576 [Candida parapsilosis]